jgi:histone H3/H4
MPLTKQIANTTKLKAENQKRKTITKNLKPSILDK